MDKKKLWDKYWDDMLKKEIKTGRKRIFKRKSVFDLFHSEDQEMIKNMMWWAYSLNTGAKTDG